MRLPVRAVRVLTWLLALAAMLTAALTVPASSARAEGDNEEPRAQLTLSVSEARPGDTITVEASGFRVEEEGSFIYSSTITIGGVPIAGVASVEPESSSLHPGRYSESGQWIAEHIHIDPPGITPDGAFTATLVLPDELPAGDHDLVAISCWAGPDGDYPEDGVAPCGTVGLGGGVRDRVATATLTILPGSARAEGDNEEPRARLTLSVSEARPGDTITVEASGFRVEEEGSFIYSSTITIGGVPIAGVASVEPESSSLHPGRYSESGQWIAEHIHIDPPGITPDGAFTATLVLPDDLPAGDHELVAISCWAGPEGDYPEDGVAPCGTVGLGGGVQDRVATATLTIVAASAEAPAVPDTGNAGLVNGQDAGVSTGMIALVVTIATLAAGITRYRLSRKGGRRSQAQRVTHR